MPFDPGDDVVVISLNRRGCVLDLLGDRYRVALGALTVVVPAADLRAPEAGKKRPKRRKDRADGDEEGGSRRAGDDAESGVHRVDLHGMTTEAAREAVLAAVNRAVLEGAAVLEVVHGIGTGRVREAALEALKRLPVVRHVRAHPSNRGITIAHL